MLRIVALVALLAVVAAVPIDTRPSKVTAALADALKTQTNVDIMIRMAAKANPIEMVAKVRLESKAAKASFVRESLMAVAAESQSEIVSALATRNIPHTSFWITNTIFVKGADHTLISFVADRLDVAAVDVPAMEQIDTPIDLKTDVGAPNGNEWGVEKINAHKVWAAGNKGEGIVVANIDTGVRWTHEALKGSYRGSAENNNGAVSHAYNWYQPTGKSAEPKDGNGHGSHTMGTIAGTNGIGVAPNSRWIACQGCATFGCSEFDLTTCGEFMTCPYDTTGANADCSKAPDVINNSWGGGQANPWYDAIMQAWIAADIVPIFSMGNSGPSCGTANSPGDSEFTTAVGATDVNDGLAYFSSRGPAKNGDRIKPEVSAPGVNIRSAWYNADNAYSSISGTSMASPHVTGTVALVLSGASSKNKASISAAKIQKDLETTAETKLPAPAQGEKSCGGTSYEVSPNYLYGYGRIDACAAVLSEGGKC